jgi:4-amino-4-deoxy-L-arabinose transferase-like glycosyltransferase
LIEVGTTDERNRQANSVLLGLAAIYFLLEWAPTFAGIYGYFIDELYYIACSEHLDLGYVDHPPVSILLLRLIRELLGESLPALRLVPALSGAALVIVTGLIARRLGAGVFGQGLAAGAAMVGSIYHVMFGIYSMNSISLLIWAGCFWLLVEIERRDEPRLWLVFGLLAGIGLQNKHTIVLLALGLAVGLIVTPARRHLASLWLWLGLGIAAVLFFPNLLWQIQHGWPSVEFYRNADIYKNVPTPPLEILKQQFLFMNPAAFPVWGAGLIFFLAVRKARRYRHLGWIYVALLGLMLIAQKSRPDGIAAVYTVLFAGGGVLLEVVTVGGRWRWARVSLVALLLLSGAALAPLGIPLLPPPATAGYGAMLGIVPQIESGEGKIADLPQWLADRFGWEQLAEEVTAAVEQLAPEERARAVILAPSYGQAGAIEFFGRGLPPVYAEQNNYHLWGPPEDPVDVAVFAGFREETVRWLFEEVELFTIHDCEWCMPWRDESPIWIARGQKVPFREAWPELRHFE